MAFGSPIAALSPDILDAIRRRRMPGDNVDDIQDRPPSEIQDFGDPDTRPRAVGQQQSAPIVPAFTRGNDIATPQGNMDVSDVAYEPPAPIQTSSGISVFPRPQGVSVGQPMGIQVDGFGVPTNAPQGLSSSNLHQHALDKTDTGIAQPNANTYDSGTDAKGNHIGRLSRFGHGFLQGSQNGGGLLGGVFGGLLGLTVPSVGNRAVFNADNSRFQNEQRTEMGLERQNVGYQNQLDVEKRRQELPLDIARNQAYSGIRLNNDLTKMAAKHGYTAQEIQERGNEALKRAQVIVDGRSQQKFQQQLILEDNDPANALKPGETEEQRQSRIEGLAAEKVKSQINTSQQLHQANIDLAQKKIANFDQTQQDRHNNAVRLQNQFEEQLKQRNFSNAARQAYLDLSASNNRWKEYDKARQEAFDRQQKLNPDDLSYAQKFKVEQDRIDNAHQQMIRINEEQQKIANSTRGTALGSGNSSVRQPQTNFTPDQEREYQSRKAKYPNLTREQYAQYLRESQH